MPAPRARAPAPAPAADPLRARSRTTSASWTPRVTTWAHVNAIEPRWASHRPLQFGSPGAVGRGGWRPRCILIFGECLARAEPYPFPRRRARAARQTTTTRMGKSHRNSQNLSALSRTRGVSHQTRLMCLRGALWGQFRQDIVCVAWRMSPGLAAARERYRLHPGIAARAPRRR